MLKFQKYQGTGNDFIICNNWNRELNLDVNFIQKICDRKFGIGSDGFIAIESHSEFDFEMNFFNPDGSKSFCGNGSRAALKYCLDNELLATKDEYKFLAIDGPHLGKANGNWLEIKMGDVDAWEENNSDVIIDTGSPHFMHFVENIEDFNIVEYGKSIRYSERYAQSGINVNAIEYKNNLLHVRTYERGVENETLSCGTGVTACALTAHLKLKLSSPVKIKSQGGDLKILFERVGEAFKNIYLCGPAEFVFEGNYPVI